MEQIKILLMLLILWQALKIMVNFIINLKLPSLEDESDLWLLTEIAKYVMEAFCRNVGNVSQLDVKSVKQFHADIGNH